MKRPTRLIIVPILLFAAMFATGCGNTVAPDTLGVKYSDGWIEGKKFDKILEPGSTDAMLINDEIYELPLNQRSFRVEQDETADVNGRLVVPAGGENATRVAFEFAMAFKLNTQTTPFTDPVTGKHYDGGMAQKFYEELCRRYNCADGGFKGLLLDRFYPSAQAAFKDEARRFNPDELVNNVAVKTTVEKIVNGEKKTEEVMRPAQEILLEAVGQRFLVLLRKQTGGEYFCGPTFDRNAKTRTCPPVELLISSVDYENPKVQESRENKKIADDQKDTANKIDESLQKPGFLEYLKIQACQNKNNTCVVGLDSVGVAGK